MAVLKNPRWELFAQALSKGATQIDAYKGAGYRSNLKTMKRAAYKLFGAHPEIGCRVDELLARRAAHDIKASMKALEVLKMDKQYTLQAAFDNLEMALGRKKVNRTRALSHMIDVPVKDEQGNVVVNADGTVKMEQQLTVRKTDFEAYERDGPVAAKMIELIAREHGLFIETKRVVQSPLDDVPPETLTDVVALLKESLARKTEGTTVH